MATATSTTSDDAALERAIGSFPARAAKAMGEINEMMEICQRLRKTGYPSGSALFCSLSATETLPELEDYADRVADEVRIALICGWDLGAYSWWFHRVVDQETIDHARVELDGEDRAKEGAAFESFNREFEAAFPELAQKLSVSVDLIHNQYHKERGRAAHADLRPELEAALAKLAADRRLVTA